MDVVGIEQQARFRQGQALLAERRERRREHPLNGRLGIAVLIAPHPLERFEHRFRDDRVARVRIGPAQRVEAERMASRIGIDEVNHTRFREALAIKPTQERAVEAVRMITVRINDAHAAAVDDVLPDHMFEQVGFAGAGRADDVALPDLVFERLNESVKRPLKRSIPVRLLWELPAKLADGGFSRRFLDFRILAPRGRAHVPELELLLFENLYCLQPVPGVECLLLGFIQLAFPTQLGHLALVLLFLRAIPIRRIKQAHAPRMKLIACGAQRVLRLDVLGLLFDDAGRGGDETCTRPQKCHGGVVAYAAENRPQRIACRRFDKTSRRVARRIEVAKHGR